MEGVHRFAAHGTVVVDQYKFLSATIADCGLQGRFTVDRLTHDDSLHENSVVFVDELIPSDLSSLDNLRNTLRRITSKHPLCIILCGQNSPSLESDHLGRDFLEERCPVVLVCTDLSFAANMRRTFDEAAAASRTGMGGSAENVTTVEVRGLQFCVVTPVCLKPGDHIKRELTCQGIAALATHHGIYMGNGRVIHFSGNESRGQGVLGLLTSKQRAQISSTSIGEFMHRGSRLEVVNDGSQEDTDSVLLRAEEALHEQTFGDYSLVSNNCEHFADYCRKGDRGRRSRQVDTVALGVGAVAAVAAGVAVASGAAAGYFFSTRRQAEEGGRQSGGQAEAGRRRREESATDAASVRPEDEDAVVSAVQDAPTDRESENTNTTVVEVCPRQ
uniref:LRAT domain-containing protein n=1 Tax=Chromera velia CCMP2878 TaxID=1169474 RepID=A0A0G4FRN0_9ALVE|eukprot:Cvel_18427.t1-p1 / transcript=Cvel_18427.t1 / gene=Cvel_18427 / organism=Chromera_velia_CCMP2878 / gene_product=hypothetical protein / transcript_product=hypothetical protein / location=Cvel_scaffold1525:23863-26300(+) / protein_length=386 / sequence_SO=supercontig / SO=protein_coding / is_pseudo=false